MLRLSNILLLASIFSLCTTSFASPLPDSQSQETTPLSAQYGFSPDSAGSATIPSMDMTSSITQDGQQLDAKNLTGPPAHLTISVQFRDPFPLKRLQAEGLIIAGIVTEGQRLPQEIVQPDTYQVEKYPDVAITVEVEPGRNIRVVDYMWSIQTIHSTMVRERGLEWVACAGTIRDGHDILGIIGVLPSRKPSAATQSDSGDATVVSSGAAAAAATTAGGGGDTYSASAATTTVPAFSKKRTPDDTVNADADVNADNQNNNSAPAINRGPLLADIVYTSTTHLDEMNLYLMYSNSVLAFFDMDHFNPYAVINIPNPPFGIVFTFFPQRAPPPGRPRPRTIAKADCIQIIGRMAEYTTERDRFDELQALATIDRKVLGTFVYRKV